MMNWEAIPLMLRNSGLGWATSTGGRGGVTQGVN